MPISAAGYSVLMGVSGIGVCCLKNGLMKHPIMYRPWEHAIGLGLGTYLGYKLGKMSDATWLVMQDEKKGLMELRERLEAEAAAKSA